MFDIEKLERLIPIGVFLAETCLDGRESSGLYRIGTHTLEYKIGNIRMLCKGDD